jgi:hypothetical protein
MVSPPLGGPRPAPGVPARSVGCRVALVSVEAPSVAGGAIEALEPTGVATVAPWVVPAPPAMSPGVARLVGESEPETTVGPELAVVVVVDRVEAESGAAVVSPLTTSVPVPVVEVATGVVVVSTVVTVVGTGAATGVVVVVVVVVRTVVGTLASVEEDSAPLAPELMGELAGEEVGPDAGLEIGWLDVAGTAVAGAAPLLDAVASWARRA